MSGIRSSLAVTEENEVVARPAERRLNVNGTAMQADIRFVAKTHSATSGSVFGQMSLRPIVAMQNEVPRPWPALYQVHSGQSETQLVCSA